MFQRLSTLITYGRFHRDHPEPFVCQVCGPLTSDERETHRPLYVTGDWEGSPPHVQERLSATNTYLVNPAHPDSPSAALRFHPERAAELRAEHPDWPYVLGYWIMVVLLAIGIAALMGCVATGIKVTEEQLGAFQRGRTTYYDVVASLGKPTASTLHHDGTRQAVYVYSQSQPKPENFIPLVGMFTRAETSETTTVTLEFDARSLLTSYAASQGQTTVGTGITSGGRQ